MIGLLLEALLVALLALLLETLLLELLDVLFEILLLAVLETLLVLLEVWLAWGVTAFNVTAPDQFPTASPALTLYS